MNVFRARNNARATVTLDSGLPHLEKCFLKFTSVLLKNRVRRLESTKETGSTVSASDACHEAHNAIPVVILTHHFASV